MQQITLLCFIVNGLLPCSEHCELHCTFLSIAHSNRQLNPVRSRCMSNQLRAPGRVLPDCDLILATWSCIAASKVPEELPQKGDAERARSALQASPEHEPHERQLQQPRGWAGSLEADSIQPMFLRQCLHAEPSARYPGESVEQPASTKPPSVQTEHLLCCGNVGKRVEPHA